MKTTILCIVILIESIVPASGQQKIDLEYALSNNLIVAGFSGNGDSPHFFEPLSLKVTNTSGRNLPLQIKAGYIFTCTDSSAQDLIITKDILITLNPGAKKSQLLKAMCIEKHNHAPQDRHSYVFSGMAKGPLLELARFVNEHAYFSSIAQNAVWCITDNIPVERITGFDRETAEDILEFTCGLLGVEVPEWKEDDYLTNYNSTHYTIEIRGTMNFELIKPTHVIIGLFNKDGIMVRELYNINKLDKGSYRKHYSFDATVYTDPVYYVQLVEDGRITLKSEADLKGFRERYDNRY